MRMIGIDYGTKNVGIALSDEAGEFAMPLTVLFNNKELIPEIKNICKEREVAQIVLGESKGLDGVPNAIQAQIEEFKKSLEEEIGLHVVFEPEFYTSQEAARIQGEVKTLDSSAAALILRSYLDKQLEKKQHD
ncbi:Holliday junction resolvase RuvX [Candidatus Wolfebacteria bacterium]|nr:MAG: Holliday junction resolvase RuvX [Candidatus Wolfebacteria bacterium]